MSTTTVPAGSTGHRLRGAGAPGLGGYVLAVLASAGILGVIQTVAMSLDEIGTGDALVGELLVTLVVLPLGIAGLALVYGCPAALVGCLLVHLVCVRVTSQGVHVLAAGLSGAATGWVYGPGLDDLLTGWLWLELGIATALGRVVVIPLARRRQ